MAKIRSTETLKRYTDLPALLYLLQHGRITLLDPSTWDDTNDSYYLTKYKEKKDLKTVLALCLTEAEQTYHHWRIFSHGSAGICIDFHRSELITALKNVGAQIKSIEYKKVRVDGRQISSPSVAKLPFIKRQGFSAEEEIRAVYESSSESLQFLDVPIKLSSIKKITLSPWLNNNLKKAITTAIHSIEHCSDLNVVRSTLIGNAEWKKLGDRAI
jgi:hypothetical protein